MSNILKNKIDFAIIISVKNANPNGDPLNGNRPRINYDGYGEISDVALKRKIRNRLLDRGCNVLMQTSDYKNDKYLSIKDRYDNNERIKADKGNKNAEKKAEIACKEWIDVRTFGQVLAGVDDVSASIAIRGPLSIQSAFSVEPVNSTSIQITKSMNTTTNDKKGSDTMGMKHRIDFGIYLTYGSIVPQLASKTGFTEEDVKQIKEAMRTLFENDATSARPSGSMEVLKLIWWEQKEGEKVVSSAKIHRSLKVNQDGTYTLDNTGVNVEEIDGI
ncbi:MAG: type I-C CRISPR-associated protein Cas7/Csd2 [Defluviitaleaceae bacterium]|nr:type I-C CRISPR-associated protein Cas7/Csd2 [Defluviitaleaceae bacterium]